jgi:hypothetical protein
MPQFSSFDFPPWFHDIAVFIVDDQFLARCPGEAGKEGGEWIKDLSRARRQEIGRYCKALIDTGRVDWIKSLHMEVNTPVYLLDVIFLLVSELSSALCLFATKFVLFLASFSVVWKAKVKLQKAKVNQIALEAPLESTLKFEHERLQLKIIKKCNGKGRGVYREQD